MFVTLLSRRLSGSSKIATGSYTGDETMTSRSFTFDFNPEIVIVHAENYGPNFSKNYVVFYKGGLAVKTEDLSNVHYIVEDATLTWSTRNSASDTNDLLNEDGTTYHYIAIGT